MNLKNHMTVFGDILQYEFEKSHDSIWWYQSSGQFDNSRRFWIPGLGTINLTPATPQNNLLNTNLESTSNNRGVAAKGVGAEDPCAPCSISELNKVQEFWFQTSGILAVTGVLNLCRLPEI